MLQELIDLINELFDDSKDDNIFTTNKDGMIDENSDVDSTTLFGI